MYDRPKEVGSLSLLTQRDCRVVVSSSGLAKAVQRLTATVMVTRATRFICLWPHISVDYARGWS